MLAGLIKITLKDNNDKIIFDIWSWEQTKPKKCISLLLMTVSFEIVCEKYVVNWLVWWGDLKRRRHIHNRITFLKNTINLQLELQIQHQFMWSKQHLWLIYLLLQSEIEKTNNEGDRLSLTTANNTEWCVVQVTFFLFLYATLSYAVYRLKRN